MRKKQKRFLENKSRGNIIEEGKDSYISLRKNWQKGYFGNDRPIILEIGAGRGEYTVALAKTHPGTNFIGIDVKGDRLWYGSNEAIAANLQNLAFLRTGAERLRDFFREGEIEEIWLTFPGPHPKKSQENRRLTHHHFLEVYKYLLKPGGVIHLKTDSLPLHQYTKKVIRSEQAFRIEDSTKNLYKWKKISDELLIKTHFEQKFLRQSKPITYLKVRYLPDRSPWRRFLDALRIFRYD